MIIKSGWAVALPLLWIKGFALCRPRRLPLQVHFASQEIE